MKNFLILANTDKDVNLRLSHELEKYICTRGAYANIISDRQHYDGDYIKAELLSDAEVVVVLGGDGTMLRAVHSLGGHDIPMLGVNLGTLGFLTETEEINIRNAIDRLIADDYRLESRMMIEGRVKDRVYHALNDVVITRAGFSRIIGLNIYVNGQLLDTYEADGVIVSTPTGSTGYNLSAGGPIVSPKSKVIVVTPISPHSLTSKSVVFDSSDNIRIEIVKKRKTQVTEAIVSFDGADSMELSAGDIVSAVISERRIRLVKLYDVSFYSVLRDKIGGL